MSHWAHACIIDSSILLFSWISSNVMHDRPKLAVFSVLVTSPIPMWVFSVTIEHRSPTAMFDLGVQSWAFLLGDSFALTSVVTTATYGWRLLPRKGWYESTWWACICIVIGQLGGIAFHLSTKAGYYAAGAASIFNDIPKGYHDWGIFPALLAALMRVGIPLFCLKTRHKWAWLACCLVGWGVLALLDQFRHLVPGQLV